MSEETPSVEEIKDRLKVEIPVEEEEEVTKSDAQQIDVVAELKDLGRQFAETVQTAWNSEERQKIEGEIREGVNSFVNEIDKAIREAKEGKVAEKVKEETSEVGSRIKSGEFSQKARESLVQGLQWISEEMGKLADQFTPKEKEAPVEEAPAAEESE